MWKERASYRCNSLLWFILFHKYVSTIQFNKINMLLETVANIYLFTSKYVKTSRRLTSEANEHTYGSWRIVIREFSIYQVIGIEEKPRNYVKSVFEGDLKT